MAGRCPSSTSTAPSPSTCPAVGDAAIFDVSHLGTVRLAGPDAKATLQRALTNDLGKIAPGRAQYTHLLDDDGSVLDDLIVWWAGEETFDVMPNASNTSRVLGAIGGTDVTGRRAVLAVQGPQSRNALAQGLPGGCRCWPLPGGGAALAGCPCDGGRHGLHRRGRRRVLSASRTGSGPVGSAGGSGRLARWPRRT